MDTICTYINVLKDTLQKKKSIMEQIYGATKQQKDLLQSGKFNEDEFQRTISLKGMYLDELQRLDNGFEQIYKRVALALKHNKDMYKDDILAAQKLIQEIMDLSVSIRAMEEQNKERFPACIMERRRHFGNVKTNSKIVNRYYKNMPNVHKAGQSYFVDEKN